MTELAGPSSARPDGGMSSSRPPLLSICVPTFNRPDLVQRAIGSIVRAAAGAESEVEIVVSDNSPDRSEGACRTALAEWRGRSLYLANRPDIGIIANFNQCIDRGSGRHILFVHDDDALLPRVVPAILASLSVEGRPDQVALFGVHVVDESGRRLRRQELCSDAWVEPRDALHRLLSDNGLAWFPGLVVRRDAYQAVGPFDARCGNAADLEMWVRLFARFGVRCVPRTISAYTVHGESATQAMAFDGTTIATLSDIFERAARTGALDSRTLRRCQARYLHQVILGATHVDLRAGHQARARQVMGLFRLASVRALGPAPEWLPVRWASVLLVRCPPGVARRLVSWADRLDLGRFVRSVGSRSRGRLPLC